jgi:FMN phosphatase YigB (HAD superfamily)
LLGLIRSILIIHDPPQLSKGRQMKLTDFKVLTFDCYGTLIDWETGMLEALALLVKRVQPPPSNDQVLAAHGRHEHFQELWTPTRRYSDLLATVWKRLAEEWGVPASWEEALAYGQSIGSWPPFPIPSRRSPI